MNKVSYYVKADLDNEKISRPLKWHTQWAGLFLLQLNQNFGIG